MSVHVVFFVKQKTAYEMRISDWSSDVCSSDLIDARRPPTVDVYVSLEGPGGDAIIGLEPSAFRVIETGREARTDLLSGAPTTVVLVVDRSAGMDGDRSEERIGGKECFSTCSTQGSPVHSQTKRMLHNEP